MSKISPTREGEEPFFKSEWCIAELAIFQERIFQERERNGRDLPQPVPLLIDSDSEATARNSPLLISQQHRLHLRHKKTIEPTRDLL